MFFVGGGGGWGGGLNCHVGSLVFYSFLSGYGVWNNYTVGSNNQFTQF